MWALLGPIERAASTSHEKSPLFAVDLPRRYGFFCAQRVLFRCELDGAAPASAEAVRQRPSVAIRRAEKRACRMVGFLRRQSWSIPAIAGVVALLAGLTHSSLIEALCYAAVAITIVPMVVVGRRHSRVRV